MMSRKNKIKEFVNCKLFTWLLLLLIFILLIFTTLSLQQYLYRIQLNERIRKIEDYSDFVLTILPQKRSTKTYQFEFKNIRFYFDGVEQVYINYGTTKIFFEEAVKKGLVSINNLLKNCKLEIEAENMKKYQHIHTDVTKNYSITIIENDNLQTVIFSR